MKKASYLISLGHLLENKYADAQTLQQIIENAAGWGDKSANGIMNFPAQLKKDQADLSITVEVDSGTFGGYKVTVSEPIVTPAQFAVNYSKLAGQIKNYLDKHISSFPQVGTGSFTLKYTGKDASSGIASTE